MNPVALIPARFASERLHAKPLADLGGEPLIVRVCQNIKDTGIFTRIVVAADHAEVMTVVRGAGFETVFTGPSLPSGTDRVAAAAKELHLPDHSLVVNVQGDEPFVSRSCLEAVVEMLRANTSAVITPIEKLLDTTTLMDRNAVKVAMGARQRALYFSRSPIPHVRDADSERAMAWHFRHVGVYGYTVETLQRISQYPPHVLEQLEKLEQLRWLAQGEQILCPTVEVGARGVDTQVDLEAANAYFAQTIAQSSEDEAKRE